MGTLFNQKERSDYATCPNIVIWDIKEINDICKETGWTVENVLKLREIQEMERANNIYVANGDAHDEQMAGFGHLVKDFFELYRQSHVLYGNAPSAFEKIAMEMADLKTAIIDAANIISDEE